MLLELGKKTQNQRYLHPLVTGTARQHHRAISYITRLLIHTFFTCRNSMHGRCHDLPRLSECGTEMFNTFSPGQLNGGVTELKQKSRLDHCSKQLFIRGHGSGIVLLCSNVQIRVALLKTAEVYEINRTRTHTHTHKHTHIKRTTVGSCVIHVA